MVMNARVGSKNSSRERKALNTDIRSQLESRGSINRSKEHESQHNSKQKILIKKLPKVSHPLEPKSHATGAQNSLEIQSHQSISMMSNGRETGGALKTLPK